jgi:carbon monoxide dehydrogenase subunit G
MLFEGDKSFPLPPDALAAKLGDAAFLVSSLNNAEAVKLHGPDSAEWKMRPALSFVSGILDSRLEIVAREPKGLHLRITSKGIGSGSTTDIHLTLSAGDGGTKVHWLGEITALTGLLKMVPKGLIQSTAMKVIEDIWTGVEKKLTAKADAAERA